MRIQYNIILGISLSVGVILSVAWYSKKSVRFFEISRNSNLSISTHVHIIDPDMPSLDRNFPCIKTKKILNLFETTICIYSKGDTVSGSVAADRIWEEKEITRLFRILVRNPQMDMIDIGANIGGFTMFTAGALGRFTLAVDCYLPNIERIARAVQIEKIQNRVVLVQNAIYSHAGEHLTITSDDPSGIRLSNDGVKKSLVTKFIAQSIRFDDLLPILQNRGVRTALLKIDIETSESYMCQTGSKVFEQIDIPFIMMEWHSWRINYQERYQYIIDFFIQRNYTATNLDCAQLQISKWLTDWPGNIFWIKNIYLNETFC